MNLNPEVDVRDGGGRGETTHTKSWPQLRFFFTKIHKHLLFTFSESYQRSYLTKINSNFISENVYSTHKTYRKFRIFGIWTFYGML